MSAVLTFTAPPPGFAPHTEFALAPLEGADGVFSMRALDDDRLRLYVVEPQMVVSDYAPTITDEQAHDLSLASADDAALLVVLHPADEGVSVNLMAPVVFNAATGAAAQVILDGQDYPLRAPLG